MEFEPRPRPDGIVPAYASVAPPSESPSTPSRRSAPFAMVGVLVVLALVAVALLAFTGRSERAADERLSAAQSFVAGATSVRLDYDVQATISAGEPGSRTSSVSTERMGGTAEWTPRAWRVHQQSRYGEDETIRIGDKLYTRSSFVGSTLEGELWYEVDYVDPTRAEVIEAIETYAELLDDDAGFLGGYFDQASLGVMLGGAIYISGLDYMTDLNGELLNNPVGFAETIRDLTDPSVVARTDALTTLEATMHAPADLVEAFGRPIPSGVIQLDLDADDIPQTLRLEVSEGASRYWIELRFGEWGEPLAIQPPADDELEAYDEWSDWSDFEEESDAPEVTVVDGLLPVRPNDSLGTWLLDSADAYDNHFSLDPVCEEVAYLAWFLDGSDDDGRGTYVNVDLMTFACVQVAGEELGVELGEIQPPPAGEALTMQVDDYSWLLLTGDTAALVMIDTDEEALIPQIVDSLEYVGWETLLHHTEGYGF